MARARRRWMRERGMFDPAHLVFIDETAANTKMVRLNGRCARGERLVARVPHGHWQTVTFVAALRHNAMTAPCVVNGAMNGETRNVSMTLRQLGVEFRLGCLGSSARPHSSVKYNKATCTTWQSLAEENVGLKGARCARIASGD